MSSYLQRIRRWDAGAWRALGAGFVLFGGVGLMLLLGAGAMGTHRQVEAERWLRFAAQSPLGLLIVIGAFALLAFLGAPQVALYAAAVVAFGPLRGAAYSWVATEVSAIVGFWLGRGLGARMQGLLRRPAVARFLAMIGRNGLTASFLVRLVPSAPFIIVNMAAGAAPMRFAAFALGTGLGIVPKIALTALASHSTVKVLTGGGAGYLGLVIGVIGVWIGAGWLARRWLARRS